MSGSGLLQGKVVIITGAGSGIGRAAARLFAAEGARACLFDIDDAANRATAALIADDGHSASCWQVDVASEIDVSGAVAAVVEKFGRLDGAFNNAGIEMANKSVSDLTLDDWQHMMAINLNGVFLCMKYQTRAMDLSGAGSGGAIVNMSSGDGIIGAPYASDYVAAKHGVVGLTRAAACEARYTGVRVNALLPGLILTPMVEERLFANPAFESQVAPMIERHSIGRFGKPEEVAEAACWLLSDRASFINGAMLTVDGGYTAR
jgi:2,5-dichloro-2,5-cyclohexadiene-1,4-diol dehydrogenase 1